MGANKRIISWCKIIIILVWFTHIYNFSVKTFVVMYIIHACWLVNGVAKENYFCKDNFGNGNMKARIRSSIWIKRSIKGKTNVTNE